MRKTSTLFLALVGLALTANAQSPCSDLFISEYVEGDFNNKAIEIYNPTSAAIDLSNYQLARFSNGSNTGSPVTLSGIVQPYDVKVFVLDKRDPNGTGLEQPIEAALEAVGDIFLTPVYDFNTSAMYFNGDDAVALLTLTNLPVDVIGKVGEDPGLGWADQNGALWTVDHTMVRKSSIQQGDYNGLDAFHPEAEWDTLPQNTFTGLGYHHSSCYTGPCNTPTTVSFSGLNTDYSVTDNSSYLTGSPSGGTFYGPGINGNFFDPAVAGLGSHSIVYTYLNGNGCVSAYAMCTTVDLNVGGGGVEISSTDGMDVYPIPSSGRFTLKMEDASGVISYTVYDNMGREVLSESFVANGKVTETFDIDSKAAGAYTLVVNTPTGNYTEKLVVE